MSWSTLEVSLKSECVMMLNHESSILYFFFEKTYFVFVWIFPSLGIMDSHKHHPFLYLEMHIVFYTAYTLSQTIVARELYVFFFLGYVSDVVKLPRFNANLDTLATRFYVLSIFFPHHLFPKHAKPRHESTRNQDWLGTLVSWSLTPVSQRIWMNHLLEQSGDLLYLT